MKLSRETEKAGLKQTFGLDCGTEVNKDGIVGGLKGWRGSEPTGVRGSCYLSNHGKKKNEEK